MEEKGIKLYVHAGMGKTGTSAIQAYLKRNKKGLERQGCLYTGIFFELIDGPGRNASPGTLFNRALGGSVEQFEKHVMDKMAKAIDYCRLRKLSTILWVNESIFGREKWFGPVLGKLSEITNLKIILYFRRQDSWFVSAYKQWGIRHKTYDGPVVGFEKWYQKNKPLGQYFDLYERLEHFVGKDKFELRIYEKCVDVVEDFCQLVGIDKIPSDEMNRVYESPLRTTLSLFKIYNSQFSDQKLPNDLQPLLTASEISQREFHKVSPDIDLPTKDRVAQIIEEYQEQNDKLKSLSRDDYQIAFPERPAPTSSSGKVDYSELTAALLFALVNLDKRLRTAHQRIGALEKLLKKNANKRN